MSSAILLIAHGSRVKSANDDLLMLAEMLADRRPDSIIECAYLELAEPTIPQGMQACVERGASEVRMLPFFLSAGAHVTEDLTRYQAEFRIRYPDVVVSLCSPIGLHPLVIDILVERLDEAAGSL